MYFSFKLARNTMILERRPKGGENFLGFRKTNKKTLGPGIPSPSFFFLSFQQIDLIWGVSGLDWATCFFSQNLATLGDNQWIA